nr:GNAT family N-acetyltransferase [uncultured Agathobaculum sp.]
MERRYLIRKALPDDAAALVEIYAPYVTDTAITFEYDVPTAEQFAVRIADISQTHPYLVCERDGKIVGYAYAHRVRARAAYDWAAELSIYLSPAAQGQGVGTALYRCLLDLLARQHLCALYGCVTLPNEKSQRLHEALGFSLAGVWHGVGWKHGGWHDVGWFEKRVGDCQNPSPVIPFARLGSKKIQACLQQYTEKLNDGG